MSTDFQAWSATHCVDAPTDWNQLLDHGLESGVTFIIRKNGSNYEGIDASTGKLVSDATSTNASVTIQAIEDDIEAAGGGTIIFTNDEFDGNTVVTITCDNLEVKWIGQGKRTTIIKRNSAGNGGDTTAMITLLGDKQFTIHDLTLNGNDRATMGIDSASANTYGQPFEGRNLLITNINGYCVDATNATGTTAAGIQDSLWDHCNFEASVGGVYLRAQTYHFDKCNFGNLIGASDYGVKIASGVAYTFTGCVWTGNDGYDLGFVANATGIEYMLFDGCWFETSTGGILYHDGTGILPAFHHLEFRGCRWHSSYATPHEWLRFDRVRGKLIANSRYASTSGVANIPLIGSTDTTGLQHIEWRCMDGSNEPVELTITGTPKFRLYHGFELREREVEAILVWDKNASTGESGASYISFGDCGYFFKSQNWQNWDEVIWQTRWNPKHVASRVQLYNAEMGQEIGIISEASTDTILLTELTVTSGMNVWNSGNHTLQVRTCNLSGDWACLLQHSRLAYKFTDKV